MSRFFKYISAIVVVSIIAASFPFESCKADGNDITDIQAGYYHTVALKADGSLWTWGYNDYGQIGNGKVSQPEIRFPVPEYRMNDVSAISVGDFNTYALKKDGSVWAWGVVNYGNNKNHLIVPKKIISNKVKAVFSGDTDAAIIKNDDSMWMWGQNDYMQIDSSGEFKPYPVKVMDNVKDASLSLMETAAIKNDESLWVWGSNYGGALGFPNKTGIPVQLSDHVISVFTGEGVIFFIKDDNSLWACGLNDKGQLGDGTLNNEPTPVKILDDVKSVSNFGYLTAAVKNDGSLWVWGSDQEGYLFSGTITTPQKVADQIVKAAVGGSYIIMMNTDGYVYAWGYNLYAQLGDGTFVSESSPEKIIIGPIISATDSSGVEISGGTSTNLDVTALISGLKIVKSVKKNSASIHFPSNGLFSLEGSYVITAKAGSYAKKFSFTIDKTAPSITAKDSKGKKVINNGTSPYNVKVTVSDKNLLLKSATFDGTLISWPKKDIFSDSGVYIIDAKDKAGNTMELTFTIEKAAS